MNETNRRNLAIVAEGLYELLDQMVFVGGATIEFYVTAEATSRARPTLDVDSIVEISTYSEYGRFEAVLQRKGFKHDRREGAPTCRWIYEEVTIDVMPTGVEALGFSNRWHVEGIHHWVEVEIPQGRKIRVLEAAYFLASKLDALKSRGWADIRMSVDFEDVVYLVRNRRSLVAEIQAAESGVKEFVCEMVDQLLARQDIDEAILWALDFGEPQGTAGMVRHLMENIGDLRRQQTR